MCSTARCDPANTVLTACDFLEFNATLNSRESDKHWGGGGGGYNYFFAFSLLHWLLKREGSILYRVMIFVNFTDTIIIFKNGK